MDIPGPERDPLDRMRAYIGPRAGDYLGGGAADGRGGTPPAHRLLPAGLVAPLAWLGYRKLYDVLGGVVWAGALLLCLIDRPWAWMVVAPILGGLLFQGRALYVARARSEVSTLDGAGLARDRQWEVLRRRGGCSRPGLWFGLAITVGLLTFPFVSVLRQVTGPLSCGNPLSLQQIRLAVVAASADPAAAARVVLDDVVQTGMRYRPARVRECRVSYRLGDAVEARTVAVSVDPLPSPHLVARVIE